MIFTTMDVPTSPNATHQYTLNWSNLTKSNKSIRVEIDSNGDGIFEKNVTPDNFIATTSSKNTTSTLFSAPANKPITVTAPNLNTFITVVPNVPTAGGINIKGYTKSPVKELENSIRYLEINSSVKGNASIMTYYSDEEVKGLNESTLSFYTWNNRWVKLNSTVNTEENYVLTNVSHFSIFTIAGEPIPPSITSFSPASPVSDVEGVKRAFNITVNQTVNVSWLVNGTVIQTNESVKEASCTSTAEVGIWNVSAIASNENGTAIHTWIWNVTTALQPTPTPTPTTTPTPRRASGGGGGGGYVIYLTPTPTPKTPIPALTPEIAYTPTPTLTPTPTPIPVATKTPTPLITATPEELRRIPGFEVVFAIAGLLAVAYLLRRK